MRVSESNSAGAACISDTEYKCQEDEVLHLREKTICRQSRKKVSNSGTWRDLESFSNKLKDELWSRWQE